MASELAAGQSLRSGQTLTSPNERFTLIMQSDGNLVLYDGPLTVSAAYWATGTWSLPPEERPTRADMQNDGHLVLYNDANHPAWGSGVWGTQYAGSLLVLQDDGNLVIYAADRAAIWASNTVRPQAAPAGRVPTQHVPLGGDYWDVAVVVTSPDPAGRGHPPVWGLADLHTHPAAHLAFGGRLFFGRPDGVIADALPWCTSAHGPGGVGAFGTAGGSILLNFVEAGVGHLVGGFPQFDGWPRFTTRVHQQMYVDWLRRAYEGGLRLIVGLVVNNQLLATFFGGQNFDDRTAVEAQIQAMKELADRHSDFLEVAFTPADARRIVSENRLALVLGVEVDSLGEWRQGQQPAATEVAAYLRHLYTDLGVRHIFPIHLANNAFGGTAIYDDMFNALNSFVNGQFLQVSDASATGIDVRLKQVNIGGIGTPTYDEVPGGHANVLGLTSEGTAAITEMMRLGLIIDIDHMSQRSVSDTIGIATRYGYPLVAGHVGFRELALDRHRNEYQRTRDELAALRDLGGMVAVGLHQGEQRPWGSTIVNDAPGSTKSWAQAYLYAIEQMGRERVAIGSDINGLPGTAAPRFGLNACHDLEDRDQRLDELRQFVYAQSNGVRYGEPLRDYRAYRFEGILEGSIYEMEERDIWEAIAIYMSGTEPDKAEMPGLPKRTPWQQGKIRNIAMGFRATSESQLENPLFGGNTYNEQRSAFLVRQGRTPATSEEQELRRLFAVISQIWGRWQAMNGANRPLTRSYAGQRDFDVNLDGVAHYGLLPDFLQDARNVGLAAEELAPLFRSAEDYIRLWETCELRKATI